MVCACPTPGPTLNSREPITTGGSFFLRRRVLPRDPGARTPNRVRLAAKMLAATLLPLLVLIEVAGWSLTAVNRLVRTNDTIVTRTLPALRDTSLAAESLNALVRHHARWVLLRDPAYSRLWSAR